MSRYGAMFDRLGERGDMAFGAFVMLGDPDLGRCAQLLSALVDGGADMVEVGIPFSDPVADGPVIQAAASRALRAGVRVDDCFRLIAGFRERHAEIPLGILTYANLVAARGTERFCADCADCGADSLLIADVPAIEAPPFAEAARAAGIAPVQIAATNTPRPTLERIAALGCGYTYCVARSGVTGVRDRLDLDHDGLFAALRELGAPPPVLGFGISSPEQVRQARTAGASGVICGSAIVGLIERLGEPPDAVREFVAEMKAATRL